MAQGVPAVRQRHAIKQSGSLPQPSPLANLPTELKLMVIYDTHVATVLALLRVNQVFWGLRQSLEPRVIAAAQRLFLLNGAETVKTYI